jgi:hypothetical protein
VRFPESIPVFAKEGGILPLDARKHTNSIDEPDKLKIMIFNGDGEYTLREDGGETKFRTKAEEGKQTVFFEASQGVIKRKVTLEFRNIKDGEVRVYADGTPVEAELHIDEFTSVSFEVLPSVAYTAEVLYKDDAHEYRNERFLWALTRINLSMVNKGEMWKWRFLDDKELMRNIMTAEYLTENEKILLTEGW